MKDPKQTMAKKENTKKQLVMKKVSPKIPGKHSEKNREKIGKGNPPKHTQFKPGKTGNPNGRPRKLVSTLIEEAKKNGIEPLKSSQIIDCYESMMNMTIEEITEKVNDKKQPIFVRIVGKALLSPKGIEALEKILDRAHGKAIQKSQIEFNPNETIRVTIKKKG